MLFLTFLELGATGFGASASDLIIRRLVEEKELLSLKRFKEALAIAAACPGPFHVNLVMTIGFQMRGWRGQMIALFGYCLPGLLLAALLAVAVLAPGAREIVAKNQGVIAGLSAAIAGLVAIVMMRIGAELFKAPWWPLAMLALALAAIFWQIYLPLVLLFGALAFDLVGRLKA